MKRIWAIANTTKNNHNYGNNEQATGGQHNNNKWTYTDKIYIYKETKKNILMNSRNYVKKIFYLFNPFSLF